MWKEKISIYELKCCVVCSEMICNLNANWTRCIGARSKKCPSVCHVMGGGESMIKTYIFLVFALSSLTKIVLYLLTLFREELSGF